MQITAQLNSEQFCDWLKYTKSLVNMNSFYTNFTNTHFQKVPIPHLTRTMKQKFFHFNLLTWLTRILLNTTFSQNQK